MGNFLIEDGRVGNIYSSLWLMFYFDSPQSLHYFKRMKNRKGTFSVVFNWISPEVEFKHI